MFSAFDVLEKAWAPILDEDVHTASRKVSSNILRQVLRECIPGYFPARLGPCVSLSCWFPTGRVEIIDIYFVCVDFEDTTLLAANV